MFVYVLSKKGRPLMPCQSVIARLLLKENKAKVKRITPFTIQLTVDSTKYTQLVIAGMDTGSKTIGCAAVTNNQVVYQSEVQLREDVSKKMQTRKMYRRTRRGRKNRYRPARWLNRANSRKEERLTPSIRSKVDSHLREKKFVESILPVSEWKVELASFDIHKISNPDVKSKLYQEGNQKGFYNVKAYVLDRDQYKCQKCKKKNLKLHVHHIIFKSNGGTNSPENLITLCKDCHSKLHKGDFSIKQKKSKTKHATEIGIIKSQIKKQFGNFQETFGYETKYFREQILKLSKTHYLDAVAICGKLDINLSNTIFHKKHVASGDFQQTNGAHSEKKIPTGKLFGLKKFDLVKTSKGIGFVKGKRSSGYFALMDIFNNPVTASVNIKKNCHRLTARTTTLIERRAAILPLP